MSDNLFRLGNDAAIRCAKYGAYVTPSDMFPAVRVYRYAPGRVMLQIRSENTYTNAILPFDLAKQIAAALVAEAKDSIS